MASRRKQRTTEAAPSCSAPTNIPAPTACGRARVSSGKARGWAVASLERHSIPVPTAPIASLNQQPKKKRRRLEDPATDEPLVRAVQATNLSTSSTSLAVAGRSVASAVITSPSPHVGQTFPDESSLIKQLNKHARVEDFWLVHRKHAPTSTASFLCGEGDAWRKSTALRTCPYGFRALERDDGSWEIYEATTSHNHAMKSSATTTNAGSSTTATAHQQIPGQPSLAFSPRAEASSIARVPTDVHSHGLRLLPKICAQEPKQPNAETFGSASTSTAACRHELEPLTFARQSVDNPVSDFFHGLDSSALTQQAQEVSMLLNDVGVETSADLVNLALLSPPIRKAFFDELHRRVRDHFTLVAPLLQRLFSSLESRA